MTTNLLRHTGRPRWRPEVSAWTPRQGSAWTPRQGSAWTPRQGSAWTPQHGSPWTLAVAAVVALVVVLLVAGAAPAGAHAAVRSTTPFDGARLAADEVPDQVTIEFNEDVTAAPGAIRVFDEGGDRVDVDGTVDAEGPRVVGRALGELDDGGYVVTWAVTSADGHPIRGAFVFTVGEGAGPTDALVATVFGGGDGVVGPAQVLVAGITYAAVLLVAGALVTSRVLRRRALGDVPWIRHAAVVGLVASALVVPLQAAAASGDGLSAALSVPQLLDVLTGSVGLAALVRAVGLVLVLRGRGVARLGGAVVALASFLLDGHTRTVEPLAVIVAADVLHLAAGAVWFGGLVVLGLELRRRRLADDPIGGARLVRDWSRLATGAVVGVVVAGVALSWVTVRTTEALGTSYGTTLLVKLALALVVIGLGAYNHLRVVPAVERAVVAVPTGGAVDDEVAVHPPRSGGPTDTATVRTEAGWQRLGAVVRLEVVLLLAVLAVTGWLQSQRPAAEELGIGGTFIASEQLTEELTLDVIVDPNVAGLNTIHTYLLDETGRTVSGVEGVSMQLTLPEQDIGPIERELQVAGPGHWTLVGRELALPGTWELETTVRIDTFTEETVTVRTVVGAP